MSFNTCIDDISGDALADIPPLDFKSPQAWEGFQFTKSLDSSIFRLNQPERDILPVLRTDIFHLKVDDVPLPDLSTTPSISSSEISEPESPSKRHGSGTDNEITDLWTFSDVIKRRSQPQLVSWDRFLNEAHQEPQSAYLSEQGPWAFSAALAGVDQGSRHRFIKPDALLDAAFGLVMGRGSGLFQWNQKKMTFERRLANITAAGYSPTLLTNTMLNFLRIGSNTRLILEMFKAVAASNRPLPCRVALLSGAKSVLLTTHRYLQDLRPDTLSILQLHSAVRGVDSLVSILWKLCTQTDGCKTDAEVLIIFLEEVSNAAVEHSGSDKVFFHVLKRTFRPVLAKLTDHIGLGFPPQHLENSAFSGSDEDDPLWKALLPTDTYQLMSQAQQSLKLLRTYAPDAFVCQGVRNAALFKLEIQPVHDLGDIGQVQAACARYEAYMRPTTVENESGTPGISPEQDHPTTSVSTVVCDILELKDTNPFQLNLELFESPPLSTPPILQDDLQETVLAYLGNQHVQVPATSQLELKDILVPSLKPFLTTQHRLLSFSVLQLLFEAHKVVSQIGLQMDYHMFRNADFVQRLNVALFDSDQNSGEGKRNSGGSTGLRLQSRGTWPPTSSELRVVLMGIISESLAVSENQSLDEAISFAIRDLSSEDLEKCRKVDSVHALDFLRLQYRPSSSILETVLTPAILDKYDRVFQHLLRLLRVHSVTQRLLRDRFSSSGRPSSDLRNHRLILQMHHFITALADHTHNSVIFSAWTKLSSTLRTVQSHIRNRDYERTLKMVQSQDFLRQLHEKTLDGMVHALLLKRKQVECVRVLYGIFDIILQFAAFRQRENVESSMAAATEFDGITIRRFDEQFKGHVLQFMENLRLQVQMPTAVKESAERDTHGEGDNGFEDLLLRLDVSGYWSRLRRRSDNRHQA